MTNLSVIQVRDQTQRALWDQAVMAAEHGAYADRMAWRDVLVNTYGLEDLLLLAREGDVPVGWAQLFVNRSLLGGRYAASAPLCSSGGGLYAASPEALAALLGHVTAWAGDLGLEYVEFRPRQPLEPQGWKPLAGRYSTFLLNLEGGEQQVWDKVFRSEVKNRIRKGQSFGFDIVSGHGAMDAFVDVIQRGVKELGSPAPGKRLFVEAIRAFGADVDFTVIMDQGRPIAGTVLFFHNRTVANPWVVTLRSHKPKCANQLLYWEIVKAGCRRSATCFDMGRSLVGSGNQTFKLRLGGQEHPLVYHYLLLGRDSIPIVDPSQGKFRLFQRLWPLLPNCLTRPLGARLVRELI